MLRLSRNFFETLTTIPDDACSFDKACAACKYEGRKCTKSCPLAPFFPQEEQEQQEQVLNAPNIMDYDITMMIKAVEECQRDIELHNRIFRARSCTFDPLSGVYNIMSDLRCKIHCLQADLNLAHQQLIMYHSLGQQNISREGDLLEQQNQEIQMLEQIRKLKLEK
ncbi:unnamed protein product [Eruca vesicaria subsp. sativa]|uniref:LOB domain-containing protein n=1 Tax=Eruca vesicaria subsp. sativa TaxID=29727 RepID=A0ABC8KJF5_ERUVS|nr:unnamed protein product [Eruca vesicaria subsp. sativa]